MDKNNPHTNRRATPPNEVVPAFLVRGILGCPLQGVGANTSADGGTDITCDARNKNLNPKLKED